MMFGTGFASFLCALIFLGFGVGVVIGLPVGIILGRLL